MSSQQLQTLFAYGWDTTQHLLDKAALLDDAELNDPPGYGHGAIHDLFFHLLGTQRGWRVALETGQQPSPLPATGFESLTALRAGLAEEAAAFHNLLAALSDEQIAGTVTLRTVTGHSAALPYWRVLHHLVLHNMQHHTELAHLLTLKGQSPGDIDFIFWKG